MPTEESMEDQVRSMMAAKIEELVGLPLADAQESLLSFMRSLAPVDSGIEVQIDEAESTPDRLVFTITQPAPFVIKLDIEFNRVALNMDQIEQYEPPPFPAKMTSARYQGYLDEHDTDDAWELDALEPSVLRQLIRDEVSALFDDEIHEANETVISDLRASMRKAMDQDWMASVFEQ